MDFIKLFLSELFGSFVYTVFWAANIVFLLITIYCYFGALSNFQVIYSGFKEGVIPLDLILSFVLLGICPFVGMIWSRVYYREKPIKVIKLFFGVQLPLFVVALIGVSISKQVEPTLYFLMSSIVLTSLVFGYFLIKEFSKDNKMVTVSDVICASVLAAEATYLTAFSVIVFPYFCSYALFFVYPAQLVGNAPFIMVLGGAFFSIIVMTSFILPIAMAILFFKTWYRSVFLSSSKLISLGISILAILLWWGCFSLFSLPSHDRISDANKEISSEIAVDESNYEQFVNFIIPDLNLGNDGFVERIEARIKKEEGMFVSITSEGLSPERLPPLISTILLVVFSVWLSIWLSDFYRKLNRIKD